MQLNAPLCEWNQGERPMVSSRYFGQKNQKAINLCLKPVKPSRQATPTVCVISGRGEIRPETRDKAAFPVGGLEEVKTGAQLNG